LDGNVLDQDITGGRFSPIRDEEKISLTSQFLHNSQELDIHNKKHFEGFHKKGQSHKMKV
jgi:hypothetical protein